MIIVIIMVSCHFVYHDVSMQGLSHARSSECLEGLTGCIIVMIPINSRSGGDFFFKI